MNSTPLIVIAGTDPVTNVVRGAANSTANQLSQITQPDSILVAGPGQWTVTGRTGTNPINISKAAGGAGVRHICQAILASVVGTVGEDNAVILRDGPAGVGTVLLIFDLGILIPATFTGDSKDHLVLTGLNIFGSLNTAMSLEFSSAVGNVQSLSLLGYSTLS